MAGERFDDLNVLLSHIMNAAVGKGHFRCHCDMPDCDLGTFEYGCPVCKRQGIDYDVWFDHNDIILQDRRVSFLCEHCKARLIVYWHDDESEMYVEREVKDGHAAGIK